MYVTVGAVMFVIISTCFNGLRQHVTKYRSCNYIARFLLGFDMIVSINKINPDDGIGTINIS